MHLFIYIAITVGFGGTAAFIMFNTNRNNVADIVEFKFGRRIDSMVSTCDNLVTKLAEALAVWVMGISLANVGHNAELGINQTIQTKNTICALLGFVPALICLAMAFFALKANVMKEYEEEKTKSLNR